MLRKEQVQAGSSIQACDAWCCTAVQQYGSTSTVPLVGNAAYLHVPCMVEPLHYNAAVSIATLHLPIKLLLGNLPPVCPILRLQRCRYLRLALPLPRCLLCCCLCCRCFCVSHPVNLIWVETLLLQCSKLTLLLLFLLLAQLPAGSQAQPGCSVTCQLDGVA